MKKFLLAAVLLAAYAAPSQAGVFVHRHRTVHVVSTPTTVSRTTLVPVTTTVPAVSTQPFVTRTATRATLSTPVRTALVGSVATVLSACPGGKCPVGK